MQKPRSLTENKFRSIESNRSVNKKKGKKQKQTHSSAQLKHPHSDINSSLQSNNHNKSNIFRSKLLSHSLSRNKEPIKLASYEQFAKQLKIKLPSPREKFLEFMMVPPFNRLKNHIDFISHILKIQYQFFKKHPNQIIENVARKIVKLDPDNLPQNHLLIVDEGTCFYKKKVICKGQLICRKNFDLNKFSFDDNLSVLGIHSHDYSMFVSQYLNENMNTFKKFLKTIQIFKIFPQNALEKIFTGLTLHFFIKGETLYTLGQEATELFLIYDGVVARRIIVQIDQTNKIPLQKYSKIVKSFSRFYEHKILFNKEDLVGVSQIIDNIPKRSEEIVIDQDSIIIAIDRIAIEESLDQYIIDRFQKYNLRKYPKNYDELCDNYFKDKIENKKAEERKIQALKGQIRSSISEKKGEKINNIIKMYRQRIKLQEKEHLVRREKKPERLIQGQN